jgi:AAA domain
MIVTRVGNHARGRSRRIAERSSDLRPLDWRDERAGPVWHNREVPLVVIIVGPIGSGKSTVSRALAARLRLSGRVVAVIDFDAIVAMIGGFEQLRAYSSHAQPGNSAASSPDWLKAARESHGRLVGCWSSHGADVVVHGPFASEEEEEPFLQELPAGIKLRRLRLMVSYEVALNRVVKDETPRNLSRNPAFLRAAHYHVASMEPFLPEADWTFDTEAISADEVAAVVEPILLADAAT